ncbi:MAG: CheR family methyltransferase [Bryobacteraceae bacterium]
MPELTSEQFAKLTRKIYSELGLQFEENKGYFLQKRVEKRMERLGFDDPQKYLFMLCYADPDGLEMQALANLITTNETYMFREYEQLAAFADYCLPEVLSVKEGRAEHTLRVWSAGCASGEEAYTLAIILREVFPQSQYWNCEIVATDIDQNVLNQAARARYGARSVNEVPPEYAAKHLIANGDSYTVRPSTAALVKLEHLNLHDRTAMRAMKNFDFIFCRNVLIYFDDRSRKMVVDHFYNALNPGGYVFLGHSESVGRISTAFKLRRFGPHLVYVKE